MSKISVVIPALNESEGIIQTVEAIPKAELEEMGYEVEILVVDNGSDDGTGDLAREAGAEVVYEPRHGYGYAYKAGFAHAQGDFIATADADLTYPVEDIPKFLKILEDENLDFITTNRYAYMQKEAMSSLHRLGNFALTMTTRLLFRLPLKDSQSGMWVFRKELLDRMVLRFNTMALSEELKIEACCFLKCRWREFPIQYRVRVGKVKLRSWRDGFGNGFSLTRKRISR